MSGNKQSDHSRHVGRAEDPVLVQVRRAKHGGTPGVIFFLNPASHTVQYSYPLVNLGIKEPVYAYEWEGRASREQEETVTKISLTLHPHQSALYFISLEPIENFPIQLPV